MYNISDILNYSDKELVDFIINHDDFLTNKDIIKKITTLSMPSIVKLMLELKDEAVISIFKEKDIVLSANEEVVRSLFLASKDKVKEALIASPIYLKKILELKESKNKKTIFDNVSTDLKIKMLHHKEVFDEVNIDLYYNTLKRLDNKTFTQVVKQLNPNNFIGKSDMLLSYLDQKYHFKDKDPKLVEFINKKFQNNIELGFYLLKIDTFEQLYLFEKFDLLVPLKTEKDAIVFEDGSKVKFDLLTDINKKHVTGLIKAMQHKDPDAKPHELIINAVKLYSMFGYDDAKKIIDDKFSYMTDSAKDRSARTLAVDTRRQYRLEHQDRFYSFNMVKKAKEAVNNNNLKYFQDLLNISEEDAIAFIAENKDNSISLGLKKAIKDREKKWEDMFVKGFISTYEQTKTPKHSLSTSDIYKIFNRVEIKNFKTDEKGRPIIDPVFSDFMLGNRKNDNDSLLRLIINKAAYGLNDAIDIVINNFEQIKEIVSESSNDLSLNSILDIVDITKIFIYDIKPNEQDLTLESFIKLINSVDHVNCTKNEIFNHAIELHLDRRNKNYSSIPIIKSTFKDGIRYKVMEFDSPDLITLGIDTNSCLKVGAVGEDFLRYAMTKPHSVIVEMTDELGKKYICPFVRNGNGLYGNGIDPTVGDEETRLKLMGALKDCTTEMINKSDESEKIEFATITNLHQSPQLDNDGLVELNMHKYQPIEDTFHSDYVMLDDQINPKDRRKSFVISSISDKIEPKYYIPKSRYYQERMANYSICVGEEEELDKIKLMINSINYSSIDFKDINDKMKDSLKRKYQMIEPFEYEQIIGNKDWFVAIDSSNNILSRVLPFDERAYGEYQEAINQIKTTNIDKGKVR